MLISTFLIRRKLEAVDGRPLFSFHFAFRTNYHPPTEHACFNGLIVQLRKVLLARANEGGMHTITPLPCPPLASSAVKLSHPVSRASELSLAAPTFLSLANCPKVKSKRSQ